MRCVCLLHVSYEYCYMYAIRTLYIIYICNLCMLHVYSMYVKSYLHWIWTIRRYYKARSHELWNMIETASACVIEWGKKKISTVGLTMALVKNKTSRFHIVDTYYCNQALFCCDRNNTQQQICGNRILALGNLWRSWSCWEIPWTILKKRAWPQAQTYLIISSSIPGWSISEDTVRIWRFVKMYVPGFVDKSQFHACRLMFAFKKHDLPWWRENVEILHYLWKSF